MTAVSRGNNEGMLPRTKSGVSLVPMAEARQVALCHVDRWVPEWGDRVLHLPP